MPNRLQTQEEREKERRSKKKVNRFCCVSSRSAVWKIFAGTEESSRRRRTEFRSCAVCVCIKQSRACTAAARHSSGSSVPRSTNRRNERLGSDGWLRELHDARVGSPNWRPHFDTTTTNEKPKLSRTKRMPLTYSHQFKMVGLVARRRG